MIRQFAILLVIGSATMVARPAFAQSFLERLESALGGQSPPPAAPVREPGYLGVTVDEAEQTGVVVLEVEAGGPAARAGLQKGDRLVSIDEHKLANLDGMAAALEPFFAGDTLKISFIRDGKPQTTQLTLLPPPPATPALERLERKIEEAAPSPDRPLRLGESRDRLPAEPPPPELPPTERRSIQGPFSGERPAGRLLNRVLEGVQQIDAQPPAGNAAELERHVEQLEAYIDRLERRIAELEAQLERRNR